MRVRDDYWINLQQRVKYFSFDGHGLTLLIAEQFGQKHKEQLDLFLSVPIFKTWQMGALSAVMRGAKERVFQKGEVIYSEGTEAKVFYLVRSGEVEVIMISLR